MSTTIIVAVSGGVDSVVLLHKLIHGEIAQFETVGPQDVVVAHVNHGIRAAESDNDEEFVRQLAAKFGVRFESARLSLWPKASEDEARKKRYEFLDSLAEKYNTDRVLLAHHHGDVIETAVLNMLRGSGRRGLSSLQSRPHRIRPLLSSSKHELMHYAHEHGLSWVEDETNNDPAYRRNAVRRALSDKLEHADYRRLYEHITKSHHINREIDRLVGEQLRYKLKGRAVVPRAWFVTLPHDIATEYMHAILTSCEARDIDRRLVERVALATKVATPGKKIDIDKQLVGLVTKRSLRIVNRTTQKAIRLK
jgi:tRNA(Ile)-lysidine synthase